MYAARDAASYPAWSAPFDCPSWTGRGVLDHDPGLLELVADGVGGGPVLARTGGRALVEGERDQGVDNRAQRRPAGARGPRSRERIEAENAEHRAERGEDRSDRRRVPIGQSA